MSETKIASTTSRFRRAQRFAAASLLLTGALVASVGTGCGDSLGASCELDSECDEGQVCASPACISPELVCLIPCGSDDECATNAGPGSTCTLDPLNVGCIGYCSAAD